MREALAGPSSRRSWRSALRGYERSSIGRAPVSKTGGWGFDSLRSCFGQTTSTTRARIEGRRVSRAWRTRDESVPPGIRARVRANFRLRTDGGGASRGGFPQGPSESGAMGKVKDELSASKPAKPSKAKPRGPLGGTFGLFLANLLQTGLYKPMQGWYARLYTALGLGVIAAAGVCGSTRRRSSTRRTGGWDLQRPWRSCWAGSSSGSSTFPPSPSS